MPSAWERLSVEFAAIREQDRVDPSPRCRSASAEVCRVSGALAVHRLEVQCVAYGLRALPRGSGSFLPVSNHATHGAV